MKKMLILSVMALFGASAFAQTEKYFFKGEISFTSGKDDAGAKKTFADLRVQGVYGWFFYQLMKSLPLKKDPFSNEKFTLATIGFGKQRELYNGMQLVWGAGISGMAEPEQGSQPKRNKMAIGPSGLINLSSEESNFEVEASASYHMQMVNSNYEWSTSTATGNIDLTKFFGKNIGVGLDWSIRSRSVMEKQIQGMQYDGISSAETKTAIRPFFCIKASNAMFRFGPAFRRTKNTYTSNGQMPNFNAWNQPTAWSLSAVFIMRNNK